MVTRINITMPEEFLRLVDDVARAEHRGRSELIREALRSYIAHGSKGEGLAGISRDSGARKAAVGANTRGYGERLVGSDGGLAGALSEFLAHREDVLLAYIFGSTATGKAGPLSDIDVAVLLENGVDPGSYTDRRLDIAAALEDHLGEKRVDVVVLNGAPLGIQFQVIKEGTAVYCSEEEFMPVFESGVVTRYLDFAPVEEDYMRQLANRIRRGEMVDQ